MTFFQTEVVFRVELVVTLLLCGMRTRPAVAGIASSQFPRKTTNTTAEAQLPAHP